MSMKDVRILVRRMGGMVKSVDELHGALEVIGVNGRTIIFELDGNLLSWKAYENDSDEIRLLKSEVLTDDVGWRIEVIGALRYVLAGRMAAELLAVVDAIIR